MDEREVEDIAPSALEMDLRRDLTPCKCSHVWMYHGSKCAECPCPEFREQY